MDDTFKPQDRKESGGECCWKPRAQMIQMLCMFLSIKGTILVWTGSRGLTEDSSHGQDEQLQQRVLFLIGQTQEAKLGHFGEDRDRSPYNLMGEGQTL